MFKIDCQKKNKKQKQNKTVRLQRMQNTRSKTKPIKTGKELETFYLGCK